MKFKAIIEQKNKEKSDMVYKSLVLKPLSSTEQGKS